MHLPDALQRPIYVLACDSPSSLGPFDSFREIFGFHPCQSAPCLQCMALPGMNTGSPGENPDSLLLERIKAGDERAFAEFYDRLSPLLFGLVFKILNDPREAEDVLQEGFLLVWKKAASYDSARSSPSTWATMIFRHKAIDRLRARERRDRGLEKAALEPLLSAGIDGQPDKNVWQNERSTAVHAALERLPEEQREAIRFAFFSGMTQNQISEKLGQPLGTVKARIRRGLLKLREYLTAT